MIPVSRHQLSIVAALTALGVFASLARASAPAGKTLTRFHDPVVLRTSELHVLSDRRTESYRLYRVAAGTAEPIPYQFDPRDEDGEMVFDGPPDFTFDGDDEFLFMAKDTGDRVGPAALPAGSDAALEIEVTDPRNDERGWAYLLHFPDRPPPRSPSRYASFDPDANEARADFYSIRYFPQRNFFTGMTISPAAGGTGMNILDRMKVRVQPTFSLLLTSWSPLFTEEDFSVKIDGVRNGPVRAVRRVRQSLDLGRFFPEMPGGTVYTYYYFSSFQTPSKFKVPWLVLKALRGFRFVGLSDFRQGIVGMRYWDGANPQGLRYTGHSDTEVNTTQDHDWWALSGKGVACLHVFVVPEEWKEWGIARGTVFEDDDTAVDEEGNEDERGIHAAGYSLLNMTKLRHAGSYDLNLATIILPRPYQPGDEVAPRAMLLQPLTVAVRPLEPAHRTRNERSRK